MVHLLQSHTFLAFISSDHVVCLKSQHCLLRECMSRKNNFVSSYISVDWLHSIVDGSHKYECNAQFILVAELIVFIAYLLFSNGVEATHMQPQKTIAKWITLDIHSFTLSVGSIIIHLVNKLPFNEQHLNVPVTQTIFNV